MPDGYGAVTFGVVVPGGRDTATDCNRSAVRQRDLGGSRAYCRDEANMPGSRREVAYAGEDRDAPRLEPPAHRDRGRRAGARGAGGHHPAGRTRWAGPASAADTDECLPADRVTIAFGFRPSPPPWFVELGIATDGQGRVRTAMNGGLSHQTANPRVFAGGDMVSGSDLVVTAVYQGREAAESIREYLGL